jgi:hypothetical protein
VFEHIRGDPRGRDYERYRLPDEVHPVGGRSPLLQDSL